MLEEAVALMRELWTGDTVNFRGDFYEAENARLFDAPGDVPVIVSGFGPDAVDLAARIGDGYFGHGTDPSLVEQFQRAGGHGPRYAQISVCWAENAEEARKTVHQVWPISGLSGQLMQDLPTWHHFEQAVEIVDEEQATKSTPCGPDVGPIVDSVQEFLDAGYDHLYFHQIGPDQRGFLDFWENELRDALPR
jgi:G6PDH family F420-dependent oxidoreductase